SAYLDAASAAVTEMGGKVAKKLGDGLMALFGYPVAQENDAERAVRAALSIQRALAELNRKNEGAGKHPLAARIAIDSTGPAVLDAGGEIFGGLGRLTSAGVIRSALSSSSGSPRISAALFIDFLRRLCLLRNAASRRGRSCRSIRKRNGNSDV